MGNALSEISDLRITLNISGGFNGDYYAFLRHGDTGFAVLLNRVGATGANPYGYSDPGVSVILSDSAPLGGIHLYRNQVNPNGAALTGLWQPDGRNADPNSVSDATARTATLNSFKGMDPNGK